MATTASKTANKTTIKAIAFSAYPVSDIKRARAFYEDILGLKPSMAFGDSWQEYDLGEGTFCLVEASKETPEFFTRPGSAVAFEVEDLDAALAAVKEKDVNVLFGPMDAPTCRMVVIEDPDKNVVTFHQRNKNHNPDAQSCH